MHPDARTPIARRAPWAHVTPLLLTLGLLAACADYVPPKPGIHIGPGERKAEVTCDFETPTGTKFASMRCRSVADAQREGERARRETDEIKTNLPKLP